MIIAKRFKTAITPKFRDTVHRIRQAVSVADVARIAVVTERSFHRDDLWNLAQFHQFRRFEDKIADETVQELVSQSQTPISIGQLQNETELAGRAYQAALRLIYTGRLKRHDKGKVTLNTRLSAEETP